MSVEHPNNGHEQLEHDEENLIKLEATLHNLGFIEIDKSELGSRHFEEIIEFKPKGGKYRFFIK